MRAIFSDTGQRTLNALLIVSGGATAAFLAFLGQAVQQYDLVARIGSSATRAFADALTFFFMSVLLAVVAHGTTYASHAAYHLSASASRDSGVSKVFGYLGQILMWVTVGVCVACVTVLWRGGFSAIGAFGAVADSVIRSGSTPNIP